MLEIGSTIPERFIPAYQHLKQLEQHEQYLAAFIFGSLARGQATLYSDFDAKVIMHNDNPCNNVNHPIINGVKLDITFHSLRQFKQFTEQEMERRERLPMMAESLIVFDKINELTQLRLMAQQVQPEKLDSSQYQFMQFMFYHANDKVVRNLERDPATALLAMHVSLNDLLKYHYQLQQKWWVSSKRLLADLRSWDSEMARLIEAFVLSSDVDTKFGTWSAIIEYILAPIGGRQPIAENNCPCETCQRDLAMLLQKWA